MAVTEEKPKVSTPGKTDDTPSQMVVVNPENTEFSAGVLGGIAGEFAAGVAGFAVHVHWLTFSM